MSEIQADPYESLRRPKPRRNKPAIVAVSSSRTLNGILRASTEWDAQGAP